MLQRVASAHRAGCNQDLSSQPAIKMVHTSYCSCTPQTVSACLLPGETGVYLTYIYMYICIRWRPKSLIIGWENVGSAAVSCSSHLLKQEWRGAHSYGFLIVCFGLQSVATKCVMFWFWYAFYIMYFFLFLLCFFCLPRTLSSPPSALFSVPPLLSLVSHFQGIPGEPGKRGKMGRPVKFCLNILYR